MQPVPLPFFAYLPAELLSPVGKRARPFFRKPDNRTIQVKIGLLSRIADGGRGFAGFELLVQKSSPTLCQRSGTMFEWKCFVGDSGVD